VGIYSETSDGSISYRVGTGDWVVVKVGDTIPANAEIRVNVDRDWIEVTPASNSNAVYEIHGPDSGEIIKKVTDILKGKPKLVSFPKPKGATPDAKYKDKLVVVQYLGRQVYMTPDGDENDIQYRHQQHHQSHERQRKSDHRHRSAEFRCGEGADESAALQVLERPEMIGVKEANAKEERRTRAPVGYLTGFGK
jgi:hypothetical protein